MRALVERLRVALAGWEWEVVFVDDRSPDGTAEEVRRMAREDRRVRVMERLGRRGLSSACIEGMMSSAAPWIAVMDSDLQHDERVLPEMLRAMAVGGVDAVVASRNLAAGGMAALGERRKRLSVWGQRLSRRVCRCEVTDPMSGFFLVEAEFFRRLVGRLSGAGFKILVDILASSERPARVREVGYVFRTRAAGRSKLDANVGIEYLVLLADKLIGRWVPVRFALFVGVGALGVGVHLLVLAGLYGTGRVEFARAQVAATVVAMTSNFLLNNVATFRDRRLRGWGLIGGLGTFYAACSVGAIINVAFASLLMGRGVGWAVAGVAGTGISSVWNYGVNTVLTWRRSARWR